MTDRRHRRAAIAGERSRRVEKLARARLPRRSRRSAGRDCDLVMKGGITSGIVYPLAACELARQYRFRSIGGSSAGAIGAVMVAAAEKGRATGGYRQLAEIPTELGPDLGSSSRRHPHRHGAHRAEGMADSPASPRPAASVACCGRSSARNGPVSGRRSSLVLPSASAGRSSPPVFRTDGGDWVQLGHRRPSCSPCRWRSASRCSWPRWPRLQSTMDNLDAQGFGLCVGSDGPDAGKVERSGPRSVHRLDGRQDRRGRRRLQDR